MDDLNARDCPSCGRYLQPVALPLGARLTGVCPGCAAIVIDRAGRVHEPSIAEWAEWAELDAGPYGDQIRGFQRFVRQAIEERAAAADIIDRLATVCPHCEFVYVPSRSDVAQVAGVEALPEPGDWWLCSQCCAYAVYDNNLAPAAPTVEQAAVLDVDPELRRAQAALRQVIEQGGFQ